MNSECKTVQRHIGVLFENNSQVSAVDIKKWLLSNNHGDDFCAVNIKTLLQFIRRCLHKLKQKGIVYALKLAESLTSSLI